jgi:hypothetical protein
LVTNRGSAGEIPGDRYCHSAQFDRRQRQCGLSDRIIRYSDGKADPDLVERWINLPRNTNMVHFYNPALVSLNGASTFLCQGHEPITECEPMKRPFSSVSARPSIC